MMYPFHSKLKRSNAGLSIVELMISMVIGIVLVGGTMQVFLSSKRSYNVQEGYSVVQDSSRFAISAISRDIRFAGYPKSDLTIDAFVTTGALQTTNGVDGANDVLVVEYQAVDGLDCLGQSIAGSIVQNAYYVSNGDLVCRGNGSASEMIVAEGVDGFQLQYGVDTDATLDGVANVYVSANRVAVVGNWDRVVTVRFSILINSQDSVLKTASSETFTQLDVDGIGPFDDRLSRRVFTSTALVRNNLP